jgi:predicted DNA-binding WGR domain protein
MIIKYKELIYNKGASNKFYCIKLEKQKVIRSGLEIHNYVVMAEYGRIASKPRHSIKTPTVCSESEAFEIFDKLYNNKIKSGYEEVVSNNENEKENVSNEYHEKELSRRTATFDEVAAAIERLTLQEI